MTETLSRSSPGMKSVKDMPLLQEAPPPGGFPSFRIDKRPSVAGPSGIALFAIVGAVWLWGLRQQDIKVKRGRFLADETYNIRKIVHPVLLAEWDLRYLEHKKVEEAKEAEIMKNVPGWKVGAPTTRLRWLPPLEPFWARPLI